MDFRQLFQRNVDDNEGFDDGIEELGYEDGSAIAEEEPYSAPASRFGQKKNAINIHSASNGVKLAIMQPSSYEEVMRDVVSYLKDSNAIVILNLDSVSAEQRMRIVDFMTGVVAVLDGKMKKTALCSYAVAPKNVEWISDLADYGE